jgi:pseudaminic acid synthase
MGEIAIKNRLIGVNHPPYVVAEMSANHNGSLDAAFKLVDIAKRCGASAIKLQTYRADTITLNSVRPEFIIREGIWAGKTLYELYDWAHTPWDWHKPLFEYAESIGITIFSSPFDFTAVEFLEKLNAPAYKIASFEAVDIPLIRYVAQTGKPMIISTGMADEYEIEEAVAAAREGGCEQLALLHCVSGYPAKPEEYNLNTIRDMVDRFDVVIGLSDHTLDNATAVASVALGASVIEKHFTIDRNGGGPDDSFSLEPADLAALCRDVRTAWSSLGRVDYRRRPSEQANVMFRRSLYFVRSLVAGQVIGPCDVKSVRPGNGLSPKLIDQVIGRRVKKDVLACSPVRLESLESTDGLA